MKQTYYICGRPMFMGDYKVFYYGKEIEYERI